MRVGTLIVATFSTVTSVVLASTAVLEHFNTLLLEEGELPVTVGRTPPPSFLSKWMIYLAHQVAGGDANVCNVYVAESTIPGAGMGLYTAVDMPKKSLVGSPEIVIPITFPAEATNIWRVWHQYLWRPTVPDIDVDESMAHAAFVPGLGTAVNSNVKDLTNTHSIGKAQYDTLHIHRTRDAGAGAFTPFHHTATKTFRSVTAGSELFSYYGTSFFPEDAILPTKKSFDKADKLMVDLNKALNDDPAMSDAAKEVMWNNVIPKLPDSFHSNDSLDSLPRYSWADLWADDSIRKARSWSRAVTRKQHVRSPEWLHENGFCVDFIKEGPSTIAQAGRGAFATRFIPKGTRIALAPLLHIADPEITGWEHGHLADEIVRNYSFGHEESSLLLTPHGAGVGLINHSRQASNVKLQWPKERLSCHDPDLLESPLTALLEEDQILLSLEYVATTNVYPGQELFLNYGENWDKAWDAHVTSWSPQTEWYVHPSRVRRDEPIRTVQELEYDPYPPNLYMICEPSFVTNAAGVNVHLPSGKSKVEWLPCEVTSRRDYVYTIEILGDDGDIVIEDVPHYAIRFETFVAKSDWNLPNAFRHEIGFPDDLLPDEWRTKQG